MKTSITGIVTTSLVLAGATAMYVGIAPLAIADDEAGVPETTAGASVSVEEAALDSSQMVTEAAAEVSAEGEEVEVAEANEVVAPASVNSTSVGDAAERISPNRIDTSNKEAVRKAFTDKYFANNVQIQPSSGADVYNCQAGEVNSQAADMVIGAWNFYRGLNNLDAVSIDPASPLSYYMQKAALTQAAQNTYGGSLGLSHHPKNAGFKCADSDAEAGSAHSNLAQANAFTAAEQIQWWYQDWSGYDVSTMDKDGFNDRLGHRNWLMDPYVRETAYGNVNGFNSLAVATGGSFGDYEGSRMKNPNATVPETMSWPAAGYFPAELLTSTTADDVDGVDVERWSFRVMGADMSGSSVSVTGPDGDVPVRVVNSGRFAPTGVSGYGTVLFKMSNKHVHAPVGSGVNTYTVRVSGVKGTAQSDYYYQVKLFNATATEAAPTLSVAREPIAVEGSTTIPARVNATGVNNKYQWQISSDNGRTWKDAPYRSDLKVRGLSGQSNTLSWSPTLELCKSGNYKYPCPLDQKDVDSYSFRLRATNAHGTTYTPALKAHYVHFVDTPDSIKRGETVTAQLNTRGNGDYLLVSKDVHYWANGRHQGKNSVDTNIDADTLTAKVSVTVWTYETSYRFYASKDIAIR